MSVEQVREWLRMTDNAVVLTGAGISTDSGIPDFRGPNGVWTKNPAAEKAAHIDYYMSDPDVRVRAWKTRVDSPYFVAEPNAAHIAIGHPAEHDEKSPSLRRGWKPRDEVIHFNRW